MGEVELRREQQPRVEPGAETESDAGTLTGRKWLKTSGTSFPAKAELNNGFIYVYADPMLSQHTGKQ